MDKFERRATALLVRAEDATQAEFNRMFADHSAKGTLQSGGTIKRGVAIYDEMMSMALAQIQQELGTQIRHRGRAWNRAVRSVHLALGAAEVRSGQVFENVARLSNGSNAANLAMQRLIHGVFRGLTDQLTEFGEGWTAPRPDGWHERHPVMFGIMSAVGGALVTLVVTQLAG